MKSRTLIGCCMILHALIKWLKLLLFSDESGPAAMQHGPGRPRVSKSPLATILISVLICCAVNCIFGRAIEAPPSVGKRKSTKFDITSEPRTVQKWANSGLFFVYFRSFQTQLLQKKLQASARFKLGSLEQKASTLTTRPPHHGPEEAENCLVRR